MKFRGTGEKSFDDNDHDKKSYGLGYPIGHAFSAFRVFTISKLLSSLTFSLHPPYHQKQNLKIITPIPIVSLRDFVPLIHNFIIIPRPAQQPIKSCLQHSPHHSPNTFLPTRPKCGRPFIYKSSSNQAINPLCLNINLISSYLLSSILKFFGPEAQPIS